MPTDTFWSNPNRQTPQQSVITLDSPGDLEDGPMGQLPGTTAGAIPTTYLSSARTVYPWTLDFTDADRLAQYNTLVSTQFAQFSSWHSLFQARYISQLPNGSQFVSIPASPTAGTPPDAYYILLSDNRTVLNVMSLTLADYQKLSLTDQQRLQSVQPFMDFVRTTLGLAIKGSSSDTVNSAIAELRSLIGTPPTTIPLPPAYTMNDADRAVFHSQLDLIARRYANASLVAVENMQSEIGALSERFKRALIFSEVKDELTLQTKFVNDRNNNDYKEAVLESDVRGWAISSDNSQTVRSGYQAFMRAEREILSAQLRRDAISRTTGIYDPKMDAAQLIYQLQLLYQAEAEARGDAGTEEMAQLHRLLSDYAIIQRLVNETLKAYNPKEAAEERRFMNLGAQANGNVQANAAAQSARDSSGNNYIQYTFFANSTANWSVWTTPPNDSDGFDHAAAYHWYMLAGTEDNARIGDGRIYQFRGDDPGYIESNDADDSINGEVYNYFAPDESNVVVRSGGLTAEEMRIVGMFSNDSWGSGDGGRYQAHPIELLYGATRPRTTLSDDTNEGYGSLALQRRDYWDKWSSQLADTVTILNQKNQLKQNDIENDTKQGNRHFDLGTNALRKMNEMLMSIGRM